MKSKKGIEMSLQTIVMAALALIILVVLIMLVTGKIGDFRESTNACEERGEGFTCAADSCPEGTTFYQSTGCGEGEICCAPQDIGE